MNKHLTLLSGFALAFMLEEYTDGNAPVELKEVVEGILPEFTTMVESMSDAEVQQKVLDAIAFLAEAVAKSEELEYYPD
jgi:hypothetical protein